jgi:AraC family transcriptional activator of pyochelin receptor
MEERQSRDFEKGKMSGIVWHCDDIRIGHAVSKFTELSSFSASSNTDVVRMHFGMKGDYSFTYQQLNKTFELVGGHHNIMYSKEFDMIVNAKTLEVETFGIQFPKELFIHFTQNASESLKRFSQDIMEGKSTILSNSWGTIDSPIQQVLHQIIHCKYADGIKSCFFFPKALNCWFYVPMQLVFLKTKRMYLSKIRLIKRRLSLCAT